MTPARRLGPALLLNALRPKSMVPQPDTSPPLAASTKPAVGRLKSASGANDKEGNGMLSAGADVSSVSIVRRRGVARRFG
jgi:hypothetical protein